MGRQRPYPPCDPHCQGQRPGSVFPTGHLDASMAATNLENQLHSAQKNVLFLQREHASTLKGLHAEIRRLQQHCTGAKGPHERGAGLPGAVVQSRTLTRAGSDGGLLSRLSEGISPSWSPRACRSPPLRMARSAPGRKLRSLSSHTEDLKDQSAVVRICNTFCT